MALRPLYMGLHFYLPQATASLTHVGAVAHARYMVSPKKEELVRSSDPGIHARYMQVKNLPPVDTVCGQQIVGRCQGSATSRALRRHMRDHLIGFLAHFQLGPWVPHLTPTGATTFTAETFGFGRWRVKDIIFRRGADDYFGSFGSLGVPTPASVPLGLRRPPAEPPLHQRWVQARSQTPSTVRSE